MNQPTNTGFPPRDIGRAPEAGRGRLSWLVPVAAMVLVAVPLTVLKLI